MTRCYEMERRGTPRTRPTAQSINQSINFSKFQAPVRARHGAQRARSSDRATEMDAAIDGAGSTRSRRADDNSNDAAARHGSNAAQQQIMQQQQMEVRELIEEIVKALVDDPDQVQCVEIQGTQSCVLELHVAPSDVGKVIGKRGVHADAIRRLVHAIGGKRKRRYVLEIIESR